MELETIRFERRDAIAVATLNRPDRLNAFNGAMFDDMMRLLDTVDRDDDVRALVVTGAGRAFCAGADLSGGAAAFDPAGNPQRRQPAKFADGSIDYGDEAVRDRGGRLALRIFECLKPTVAAVNGAAVGVGATMTLPMDVRIASESARYGFVFARRGIVSEGCSSWFLPRLVGIPQSLRWMLSGRVFPAAEALAGGLVSAVVGDDELLAVAESAARELTDHTSAVSVALLRQMVWRIGALDHPMEAHKVESRLLYALGGSADTREGVQSFLDKRPARFPGRVSSDMPATFPWWKDRRYE